MLPTHRLLLVGEQGVILYAPEADGVHRALSIGWEAHDFGARLAQACAGEAAPQPMTILFNDGGSSYRREENVSMSECRKKLDAAFPRAQFPARALLEVPAEGSCLLVAMPADARFDMLGRALSDAHVRIDSCGVLPVESTGLVNALADKVFGGGRKSRWASLIGQHETGGLREVVTRDGNLALTRLIPLEEGQRHGAGWAAAVAKEFRLTKDYLVRFGYAEKDGLDVMVVCGKPEARLLASEKLPATRLRCLTLAESLSLLGHGSGARNGGDFADDLHAAWAEHQDRLTMPIPTQELMRQ